MSEARERTVRRAIGLAVLVALALLGWWVVRWATEEAPPVGDGRACTGTDLPLDQALAACGLDLPARATDVHYLARADPDTGRVHLAVALHSTRDAMTDYLKQHGLTADQVAKLDDGPYEHGDVADYRGLCGNTAEIPAIRVPVPPGTGQAAVVVEMDGRAIREHTAVILEAAPN